jgi:SAM-dependent methyltransferase
MTDVFQREYSDAYDSLYQEKDYPFECDVIEQILGRSASGKVATVLDLGCGTGGHALELARRGYQVVGIDRSEAMLERARAKSAGHLKGTAAFRQGNIRDFVLDERFDAAIMMFAVLGYQTTNADVIAALKNTRRHLRTGSILIFDCWYGPAVLSQGPSQRTKIVERGDERIVRMAAGTLDTARGTCTVEYRLWTLRGDRLLAETEERHHMRYFFRSELELLLSAAGLELLRLGSFPDFQIEPSVSTWNVLGLAKAVPIDHQASQI